MKKLFNLFAFIACFTFLAITADAQSVRNDTGCAFTIQATYAKIGDCTPGGTVVVNVAAFSTAPINIPDPMDNEIIEVGGLSATSCSFNIAGNGTCSPLGTTDVVNCSPGMLSTACDNYTADFLTNLQVVWIHH